MAAPTNSPWALSTLSNIPVYIEGEGTVLYNNKAEPSIEIQNSGLLYGSALTFQHINYQFNMLYDNIEYLKNPEVTVVIDSTIARTFTLADRAKYIRFTNASAINYTINQGIATVGTKIKVRQGANGVVTLVPGSGVTFNRPVGKAAKTSGTETTITAIKISEGSGIESWDLYGELGT